MTSQEFYTILARLRAEHGADFERWYDTANFPDVRDYCEIGFLLSRCYFDSFEKEGSPLPLTIGKVEAEIARLRKEWGDTDRVDQVLATAEKELARIREERADYYGGFGRGV